MKVLHIIDSLGLGGAQTVIKGIFETQKSNKNIFLFALRKREINMEIKHLNVYLFNSNKRYSLKPIKELRKLIEKESIDILHCHLPRSQITGWILKKRYFPKIRLIFHEHSDIYDNKVLPFLFKKIQNRVNLFIAVSKATKQELIKKANIDPKKIVVLYNFVDLEKFNRKNIKWNIQKEREKLGIGRDEFVIGFAGRLIERKGWRDFIEAANILIKENKKFKFLIAGDGPEKQKMLDLIEKYNLNSNIIYLGYQSKMVWFYSLLDIFVIPSHWEGLPMAQLEVMDMGIPMIS